MLRSVKNLSDELGVEKFKIYKFIKDNNLKVTRLGSSRVMYFDDLEADKIIRAFTPETAARAAVNPLQNVDDPDANADASELPPAEDPVTTKYSAIVHQLRQELSQKDQQIAVINGQLASMTGALRNANDCVKRLSESTRNLTDSLRASQAMYLSAVKQIAEEQEKTKLLQGQVAEAEAAAAAETQRQIEEAVTEAVAEAVAETERLAAETVAEAVAEAVAETERQAAEAVAETERLATERALEFRPRSRNPLQRLFSGLLHR